MKNSIYINDQDIKEITVTPYSSGKSNTAYMIVYLKDNTKCNIPVTELMKCLKGVEFVGEMAIKNYHLKVAKINGVMV